MFTVLIALKEYIDKINEYELFLKPFTSSEDIVFCEWNPNGKTFAEMLPELPNIVGRRRDWRAMIICDESGLDRKNPFDMVDILPQQFEGNLIGEIDEDIAESYEAYRVSEHEKKLQAYEEAAKNPLTRLVTFFCQGPTVTMQESQLGEDPEYHRYIAENEKKEQLRKLIRNDELIYTSAPTDVICVAKRTVPEGNNDFEIAWAAHNESEYSRFYDRNMYFDKMRYLVFDILPKSQRNYSFDYVRFLYATLLLASNEIPSGILSPNRVYNLECENDEKALRDLLHTYEAKLNVTKELLEQYIKEIKSKQPVKLSDSRAEAVFCAKVSVPVILNNDFKRNDLYVSHKELGLSQDCPSNEFGVWESGYKKSKKSLHALMKQSRRSVTRAAKDAREEKGLDLQNVLALNEFQLDDVREHISNEELAMISIDAPDLYNEDGYVNKLDKSAEKVRKKIATRMPKGTTLALGGALIIMYILGFITLLYTNSSSDLFNITTSLIVMAAALGVFALIGIVVLFFLRYGLVKRIKGYNRTMNKVDNEVDAAMAQYSVYLSHVCNVRRGFTVLDAAAKRIDPDATKVILYRKHIIDIETAKAELNDVFGHFIAERSTVDTSDISEYNYNFDKPIEYVYPIPYSPANKKTIVFLKAGTYAEVPVNFVKKLTVRREELYD